jgi:hypothetical protein
LVVGLLLQLHGKPRRGLISSPPLSPTLSLWLSLRSGDPGSSGGDVEGWWADVEPEASVVLTRVELDRCDRLRLEPEKMVCPVEGRGGNAGME